MLGDYLIPGHQVGSVYPHHLPNQFWTLMIACSERRRVLKEYLGLVRHLKSDRGVLSPAILPSVCRHIYKGPVILLPASLGQQHTIKKVGSDIELGIQYYIISEGPDL